MNIAIRLDAGQVADLQECARCAWTPATRGYQRVLNVLWAGFVLADKINRKSARAGAVLRNALNFVGRQIQARFHYSGHPSSGPLSVGFGGRLLDALPDD